VSLPDQLCESVLYAESADAKRSVDRIFENGSAVGISFTDSAMMQFVKTVSWLKSKWGSLLCDDFSGFDSLHTLQTLLATNDIDKMTHKSKDGELNKWNLCNRRWSYKCAYGCSVIYNQIYAKVIPGMINSGSKNTSRENTTLRNLYTYIIATHSGQPNIYNMANGDDGLTFGLTNPVKYEESANTLGFRVRDVEFCESDTFEFCSHRYSFSTGVASLTSWPKAMYGILSKNISLSDVNQTIREMRHNSEYPALEAFVSELDLH
jgi:hypothetical protein